VDNNGWIGEPAGGVAHGDGSLVGERKHKYIKNTNTQEKQNKQETRNPTKQKKSTHE